MQYTELLAILLIIFPFTYEDMKQIIPPTNLSTPKDENTKSDNKINNAIDQENINYSNNKKNININNGKYIKPESSFPKPRGPLAWNSRRAAVDALVKTLKTLGDNVNITITVNNVTLPEPDPVVTTEAINITMEDTDIFMEDSDITMEDTDLTMEDTDIFMEDSELTMEDTEITTDVVATTEFSDFTLETISVTPNSDYNMIRKRFQNIVNDEKLVSNNEEPNIIIPSSPASTETSIDEYDTILPKDSIYDESNYDENLDESEINNNWKDKDYSRPPRTTTDRPSNRISGVNMPVEGANITIEEVDTGNLKIKSKPVSKPSKSPSVSLFARR